MQKLDLEGVWDRLRNTNDKFNLWYKKDSGNPTVFL